MTEPLYIYTCVNCGTEHITEKIKEQCGNGKLLREIKCSWCGETNTIREHEKFRPVTIQPKCKSTSVVVDFIQEALDKGRAVFADKAKEEDKTE